MDAPTSLETSRLRLRLPKLADASNIFNDYAQDLDVVRYLGWAPHTSVSQTEKFLSECVGNWRTYRSDDTKKLAWIIEHKDSHQLLGMIELRVTGASANAGYVLAKRHWGKGLMTEALTIIRILAMEVPDIYRFWVVCDVDNTGSWRVMEKAGLKKEGRLRRFFLHPNVDSVPRDCFCYSVVK